MFADIGGLQHSKSLGIGGHHPVLDPVVHHFHEVAAAAFSAMQITLFGGAVLDLFASWRAWNVPNPRRDRFEDRIEVLDGGIRPANHHAIAALQSPHTPGCPNVNVFDSFGSKLFGAADIVNVVGVASIDEDVAGFQMRYDLGNRLVHNGRRNHKPD